MLRIMLSMVVLGLAVVTAGAQLEILHESTYGGARHDGARDVAVTGDGGYLLTGFTFSEGSGGDLLVVCTSPGGTPVWTRTFGGPYRDYGFGACVCPSGGFGVTGYRQTSQEEPPDLWVLRLDEAGDLMWERTFGGTGHDEGRAVAATADGRLLVAGCTWSRGQGEADLWLLNLTADGDTIWTRTAGGAEADWACAVGELADGSVLCAGTTGSRSGNRDIYATRFAADGVLLWEQGYGLLGDIDADWGHDFVATPDGGFVLAGYGNDHDATDANDLWLIRADAAGETLWSQRYGEPGDYYDHGLALAPTPAGGYLIAGTTRVPETQRNLLYLVGTDAQGNRLWRQTVGGEEADYGLSLEALGDGRYIVAGLTASQGAGGTDAWLLDLHDPTAQGAGEPVPPRGAQLAPIETPVRDLALIRFRLEEVADVRLRVLDATGRVVATLARERLAGGRHTVPWIPGGAASGTYHIMLEVGRRSSVWKTVVVR